MVRAMVCAAPRTFLARLRHSTWLAGLLLLVFALKISAASACAKHDFADLGADDGAATAISEVTVSKAPSGDSNGDRAEVSTGHGSCTHGGCHHAAAVAPHAYSSVAEASRGLTVRTASLPPSASPHMELRPPIA